MRKWQKKLNFSNFSLLFVISVTFILFYFNLHYLLLQIFISRPLTFILLPHWCATLIVSFGKFRRKIKERMIFYTLFITFIVLYISFFSNLPLIVAQTACPSGTVCGGVAECTNAGGHCVQPCTYGCCCDYGCSSNSDCPSGKLCCNGECTDPATCTYKLCQYDSNAGTYLCKPYTEKRCPGSCPSDKCTNDMDCQYSGCDCYWNCYVCGCESKDGWYCSGDYKQYRDYYCGCTACEYEVTQTENCNDYDYCYGRKLYDYTCSDGSCVFVGSKCSKACGSECETNSDCTYGCDLSTCKCNPQPTTTTTPTSCPSGTTCIEGSDCENAGGRCVEQCGSGLCCCCPSSSESCSSSGDEDCDGLADCADPDCAGKTGPTGDICCQTSSDCPSKNNKLPKCENNICKWPPCQYNSECVDGACCDAEKGGSGNCVSAGSIYASKYLCDPPGWSQKK